MSVIGPSAREQAGSDGEAAVVGFVGAMNVAVAGLVATIRMLVDTGGWEGWGIHSVEHWVCWKACVSRRRAEDLVRIARHIDVLPECWGLFEQGKLTEEAMALIVRRVPANRDGEVARLAPNMTISQLRRGLRAYPDKDAAPKPERRREFRSCTYTDGWGTGSFCLPPDEMATLNTALGLARDAEFRDRQPDADDDATSQSVEWADAWMRLIDEGLDGLDPTLHRTGRRGERTKVVLHHEIREDGSLGAGRLHVGEQVPDAVARFLRCDAEIQVVYHRDGRIVGVDPTQRVANRALRRALEHRDQGCAHPLCHSQVGLVIHHILEWANGGLTVPANLLCLCRRHHRQLHMGDFTITGNPEDGSLRFNDSRGRPIEPPDYGSTESPDPPEPSPYAPPCGEPMSTKWFGWNTN